MRFGRLSPWLYLVPAVGLLITFTYVPVGNMLWYSFHKWDGLDVTMEPAGWSNYVRVFTDERYWRVFLVSLYYFAELNKRWGAAQAQVMK